MYSFLIKAPDILCFTITAPSIPCPFSLPLSLSLSLPLSLSRFVDDLSYFGGLAEIARIQFISLIK